jgi:hypothetical protein
MAVPRSIAELPTELRALLGVQVGEMTRVARSGFETLHTTPHGLFRAGRIV